MISCVAAKSPEPQPAKLLYLSDWFKKALAYVQTQGGRFFILSAKHGLIHPDAITAPYEKTLNNMPIGERRKWARQVRQSLEAELGNLEDVELVVLAGRKYREFLDVKMTIPMEGLGIGEQKRWLKENTR